MGAPAEDLLKVTFYSMVLVMMMMLMVKMIMVVVVVVVDVDGDEVLGADDADIDDGDDEDVLQIPIRLSMITGWLSASRESQVMTTFVKEHAKSLGGVREALSANDSEAW
jgi:hypothetical protein